MGTKNTNWNELKTEYLNSDFLDATSFLRSKDSFSIGTKLPGFLAKKVIGWRKDKERFLGEIEEKNRELNIIHLAKIRSRIDSGLIDITEEVIKKYKENLNEWRRSIEIKEFLQVLHFFNSRFPIVKEDRALDSRKEELDVE